MKKSYLLLITIVIVACQQEVSYPPFIEDTAHLRQASMAPFYHGVASGDPLQDRVIIWTRVTPPDSLPEIQGTWEVADNENFENPIASGALLPTQGGTIL